MIRKCLIATAALMLLVAMPVSAREHPFMDTSPARQFLELRAYALGGGSTVTQNYISCFPQINELNVTTGAAFGVGVSAQFAIRDFLALGTELNLLVNHYNLDLAVTGSDLRSVSSVFLRNRYCTLNVPVFISGRFHVDRGVAWNVDCGLYYSLGLAGRQWQSIYDSRVNDIGQLVMQVEKTHSGYYGRTDSFINSSMRGDIGLHLGTGLTFGRHVFLGLRSQIGFRNIAKTDGIKLPNIHNVNILAQLGYKF